MFLDDFQASCFSLPGGACTELRLCLNMVDEQAPCPGPDPNPSTYMHGLGFLSVELNQQAWGGAVY